jgi:hypothetical protein
MELSKRNLIKGKPDLSKYNYGIQGIEWETRTTLKNQKMFKAENKSNI